MKCLKYFSYLIVLLTLCYACSEENGLIPNELPSNVEHSVNFESDASADNSRLINLIGFRGPLRGVDFAESVPNSIYYNFNLAVRSDVEIFGEDCCVRDDVVEIYVDGCYLGSIDSRGGEFGTHVGETLTAVGLSVGDHQIEYRNVISTVGESGWYLSETESPATVLEIDGCDSGVSELLLDSCDNLGDLIAECAANAGNHGQFVRCVAHLTNDWKKDGLITGDEKDAIMSCAAESDIP